MVTLWKDSEGTRGAPGTLKTTLPKALRKSLNFQSSALAYGGKGTEPFGPSGTAEFWHTVVVWGNPTWDSLSILQLQLPFIKEEILLGHQSSSCTEVAQVRTGKPL